MSRLDYCSPDTLDVARRQRRRRLRWIAILVLAVVHMVLIHATRWAIHYFNVPRGSLMGRTSWVFANIHQWLRWPVPYRIYFGQEALRVWIAQGVQVVAPVLNSFARAYLLVMVATLVVRWGRNSTRGHRDGVW